jgi:hypothetical protein
MSEPQLEIVIDELVLRGIEPADTQSVSGEIVAQLRMLSSRSVDLPSERTDSFLRLAAISVPAGSPAALGGAVATAVWTTLTSGGDA